jgi:hypothetical protein
VSGGAKGERAGAPPPDDTARAGRHTDPSVPAPACDLCGYPMRESHCKLICDQCGYVRDCSDP